VSASSGSSSGTLDIGADSLAPIGSSPSGARARCAAPFKRLRRARAACVRRACGASEVAKHQGGREAGRGRASGAWEHSRHVRLHAHVEERARWRTPAAKEPRRRLSRRRSAPKEIRWRRAGEIVVAVAEMPGFG